MKKLIEKILDIFKLEPYYALKRHNKGLMMSEEKIYNIQDLSERIKLSRRTVMKLLGTGEIKAKKVGGKWRILESSIIEYLKKFDN